MVWLITFLKLVWLCLLPPSQINFHLIHVPTQRIFGVFLSSSYFVFSPQILFFISFKSGSMAVASDSQWVCSFSSYLYFYCSFFVYLYLCLSFCIFVYLSFLLRSCFTSHLTLVPWLLEGSKSESSLTSWCQNIEHAFTEAKCQNAKCTIFSQPNFSWDIIISLIIVLLRFLLCHRVIFDHAIFEPCNSCLY